MNVEPIEMNGEQFLTVSQFAGMISRTSQTVYNLINKGNKIRRLKHINLAGKPLIYLSEVYDFPFTVGGPKGIVYVYFYNKDGSTRREDYDHAKYQTED